MKESDDDGPELGNAGSIPGDFTNYITPAGAGTPERGADTVASIERVHG